MNPSELARDIVETYRSHRWDLRRLLVRPDRRNEIVGPDEKFWEGIPIQESTIEAIWFSRPSTKGRESWELRLLSENPYALFENFEVDETEELREAARQEMEARMRERTEN